jgi:hypothetical protein
MKNGRNMSIEIDFKIWRCWLHTFKRQPSPRLGKLSRSHRRKGFCLNSKSVDILPIQLNEKNMEMSLFDLQTVSF